MPRKRVYELAKELGVGSKNILAALPQMGITVKSHSSALEDKDVERIRGHFAYKTEAKAAEAAPRVEPSKAQVKPPRAQASKAEVPRAEPSKAEAPKVEVQLPKTEAPKPLPRPKLDADGNPIRRPKLDADGNPIRRPKLDANGNPIRRPKLDADGNPIRRPKLDANGNPIIQKPENKDRQDNNRRGRKNRGGRGPNTTQEQRPINKTGDNRPPRPEVDNKDRAARPNQDKFQRPPRPDGQRQQDNRPPRTDNRDARRPQSGDTRTDRPGGYRDKPEFNKDNRGRSNFNKGSASAARTTDKPKPKTGAEAPDKHGRRQKLEASTRASKGKNKFDRIIQDRDGHIPTPKPAVKQKARNIEPRIIQIPASLTLRELAELMNVSGSELVKSLMKKGEMINITQEISFSKAEAIAMDYNVLVEEKLEIDILEEVFAEESEGEEILEIRPPVVVVMGHVDHGKTSLLDAIRKTDVVVSEAGGITQHIGAYTVAINERQITFLDTPGHEAFTAMRMRGAQVTDIAILVVAADDGVMPQTVEAISHAKAAGVEIIVAINKIDKPSANPQRVMQELTEHGLVAEEWGGETICVPVSAATKQGIDSLLEMILLVSDVKEYKANPNKRARGTVIEALLDKGRGPVATILVQAGTLKIGDPVVAGTSYGRVRAMIDDKGRKVKEAAPSIPVEIQGLASVPTAGDLFHIAKSEKEARYVAETILAKHRTKMLEETPQKVSLDDLFIQIKAGKFKDLNVIIKGDVQGSVEALRASLEKLSNDEVRIKNLYGGVGAITESDIMLASASNAIIIGFNVRPEPMAKTIADDQKVDVRLYRIIYDAINDIQAAMKGLLDPVYEEKVIGHAQIRQIFRASGVGTIGGSYVTDGKITRNASVRILRDNVVVYEGGLETLRRFKEDVREVSTNYECGLLFVKFNDIKEGDIVEAFIMEEIER